MLPKAKPEAKDDAKKKEAPNYKRSALMAFSQLFQIGATILGCVFLGFFLGRFLDNWLDTSPALLIVFTLIGAGAGLRSIFELAKRF